MEYYGLSVPQQNIWNLQKFYGETSISNLCGAIFFNDKRNVSVLKSAIYKFIDAHTASYTKMLGSGLRLNFRNINTLNLSRAMVKMYNQFVISVYSNSGGSKGEIIEVGVLDANRIVSCE